MGTSSSRKSFCACLAKIADWMDSFSRSVHSTWSLYSVSSRRISSGWDPSLRTRARMVRYTWDRVEMSSRESFRSHEERKGTRHDEVRTARNAGSSWMACSADDGSSSHTASRMEVTSLSLSWISVCFLVIMADASGPDAPA